jgi:hypothetical protein
LPVVLGPDWLVVVADFSTGVDWAFWADGVELGEAAVEEDAAGADELELVWFCAAGDELALGSLGDWANAPVPSIKPTVVVIKKCPFMFLSWGWFA